MDENSGVRLTGLWKHEKPDGSHYYAGKLGTAQLLVFKVKEKTKENDPDLVVYLAKTRSDGDHERSVYAAPQTGGR